MRTRIEWIDFAKGIGIICVILGHMSFIPINFKIIIYSFHMPLFFFLTGLTFNENKYKSIAFLLKDKFKNIIIPYFIFSMIYFLYEALFYLLKEYEIEIFLKRFIGVFINIRNTEFAGGIWFLTCIVGVYIILYFSNKLTKRNKYLSLIVIIILFSIGYMYSEKIRINLPWAIDIWPMASFFALIGCMCSNKLKNSTNRKINYIFMSIIFFIFTIILAIFSYNYNNKNIIDMYSTYYGNPILFLLQSCVGIIGVISLAKMFEKSTLISKIGRNSMYYYGMHTIIISCISMVINKFNFNYIIESILVIVSLVICITILNKIKYFYEKIYNKILLIGRNERVTKNE